MKLISISIFILGLIFTFGSEVKAATLVNDFTGAVTGYNFTSSFADAFAMSSPTASPASTGNPGQVDTGFYTVNYRDMPFFYTGQYGIVNAYSGDMGSWSGTGGFYTGGSYFDLAGITGFLVSLRKEAMNTVDNLNFYILTNQDMEVSVPIATSSLSTTQFTDVFIDLQNFSGYSYISGLQASQIGIRGDGTNSDGGTYNFSIDSLRAVPEPSTGLLLLGGLAAVGLFRRREKITNLG